MIFIQILRSALSWGILPKTSQSQWWDPKGCILTQKASAFEEKPILQTSLPKTHPVALRSWTQLTSFEFQTGDFKPISTLIGWNNHVNECSCRNFPKPWINWCLDLHFRQENVTIWADDQQDQQKSGKLVPHCLKPMVTTAKWININQPD